MKKCALSEEQILDKGGKKYNEKTKAKYCWFADYDDEKFYITKALDAYNVRSDLPEKCQECCRGR